MKNKSWKYPLGTMDDKMFDSDKDGELDGVETFFRDCHLDEMSRKSENGLDSKNNHAGSGKYLYEEKNDSVNTNGEHISGVVILFVIFFSLAIIIGAFVLAFKIDGDVLGKGAILLGAVGISLLLFRSVGLFG